MSSSVTVTVSLAVQRSRGTSELHGTTPQYSRLGKLANSQNRLMTGPTERIAEHARCHYANANSSGEAMQRALALLMCLAAGWPGMEMRGRMVGVARLRAQ